jgi:hypothetical protein
MAATKAEVVDGAQEDRVVDVKEILVQWDAGASISGIAQNLGCSRPTVRKYVQAGQRVGLVRDTRRIDEVGWERAARAAIAQVAGPHRVRETRCGARPPASTTSIHTKEWQGRALGSRPRRDSPQGRRRSINDRVASRCRIGFAR